MIPGGARGWFGDVAEVSKLPPPQRRPAVRAALTGRAGRMTGQVGGSGRRQAG